jgi:hypothetical protein
MTVGLAGCGKLVAPNRPGTVTTLAATGVDKDKFAPAWDKLKDILVATAVAVTLDQFHTRVQSYRTALDAIDETGLNADEKVVRLKFYDVYWAFEDSVSLWTADVEGKDMKVDGIPLYRDGKPLIPRADQIVSLYGLAVTTSQGSDRIGYAPKNSVQKLWGIASHETEKSLLPALNP